MVLTANQIVQIEAKDTTQDSLGVLKVNELYFINHLHDTISLGQTKEKNGKLVVKDKSGLGVIIGTNIETFIDGVTI